MARHENSVPVLVTGACGLVGRATVARLAELGVPVVATDIRTPSTERVARGWRDRPGVRVEWCDLTSSGEVEGLLTLVAPSAVVHLAAIIPPLCYAQPALARRVNVDATRLLLEHAEALPRSPRIVHASSVAVYGARNPHRVDLATGTDGAVLTADLPMRPTDLYGLLKAEAEQIVRESALEWVVLRLGGVMSTERQSGVDLDMLHFGTLLPSDGRIQTVDVRDVAHAFAAATTAQVTGEILLIGGDDTHRLHQRDISRDLTAAAGLPGLMPLSPPGDPDDDTTWFATDWMDTTRAQEALGFQHHSWADVVADTRRNAGPMRLVGRPLVPVLRPVLGRRIAQRGRTRPFATMPAQA
ncbi:NAD(P)-dependent oxidoreductase [Nocardioides sp. R-C-SC26]|uniref:NAD-dependent epimerase/dehydratase family protein n=1 Tax=Nocardioides sp. R-C-SC26 TaxID=2870414 RepID=UPI001E41C697|nr:NAD(P)-dependent oxidoreductase [Nocardioides sp. R-C-SC26]